MRELINFCFKGKEKQFIAVAKIIATWTDNKKKFQVTFDKNSLKLVINFLLDNCFLVLVSCPFNKSLLFPWGFDPASFIANLFLYYYDDK